MGQERFKPARINHPDDPLFGSPRELPPTGWIGEGVLSRWDEHVKRFVGSVANKGRVDVYTAQGLARAVMQFEEVTKPVEEIIKTYARIPAADIIQRREIFVPDEGRGGLKLEDFPNIQGCLERSLVLATSLRCLGVPAVFTREGTHSTVRFKIGDDTFEAGHEPYWEIFDTFNKLDARELAKSSKLRAKGLYREGLDQRGIGMNSIMDFFICAPNPEEHLRPFRERYRSVLEEAGLIGKRDK
jgi:hypothetical protein